MSLPGADFTVAFDPRDEAELWRRWRSILRSQRWSGGQQLEEFEQVWSQSVARSAVGFDNWSGGALAILDFIGVGGEDVLCPSNTFLATPRATTLSGGRVVFYDCNKEDLCGSYASFVRMAEQCRPRAAWIVHIGGHIAFDIQEIADYCRANRIWLIEDCAHAHGAVWNGKRAGTWGDAGVYSFYATKTITTGEGGMVVTDNEDLLRHLRSYRDYGRGSGYSVISLNHRMSEFTAALGVVQTQRLADIIAWKQHYARYVLDPLYGNRVRLPSGMQSGYYKYIVFDAIERSTGKVYELPCHRLLRHETELPNTDWVAKNHWCVPIYYPREGTRPPYVPMV